MATNLALELRRLVNRGCHPTLLYHRYSKKWIAEVDYHGIYWANAPSPRLALSRAVEKWEQAGKPKDSK